MAYCVKADMVSRFSEVELIQLTDRDDLGVINDTVLDLSIDDASAEIDGYLGKYTLPLVTVPLSLTRISCDIARYYLYDDMVPSEGVVKQRFEDALKFLRAVAKGDISLGVDDSGDSPEASDGATMTSGGRVFSRNDNGFL